MDGFPDFWHKNKILYDTMIMYGYKYVHRNGCAFFEDHKGKYIEFPEGYITGVGFNNNGTPYPYYASVNTKVGWAQRSFKTRLGAISWALEYHKEHFGASNRAVGS